ncbi:hypothetical protein PAESOLCIP111_05922 [Paenibacillus solanacearum]|uniref:Recombinase zinc beta ribbon domain-containing protein n=1 Tax=Paenibacillus solanacearum TaxID=2048548 RepID=A0A916K9Z1_9BACL|nr:hypothetical protein PAESOLCIP111_05922 [Paenibacillus solanacearum]
MDNPFFVGKVRYNRYTNWSERRRKGKNPNPLLVDGHHPPIIVEELWEKVQFLRERKAYTSTKRFHGNYELTGLIRCPQCGAAMTASRTNSKDKHGQPLILMYYSCGAFRSKGSAVCGANSVRKKDAERYVIDRIKQALAKPHILQAIVKSVNDRKGNQVKPLQEGLSTIRSALADVQAKKLRYLDLYENDQFDSSLFAGRLSKLEGEINRLHARWSELELDGNHSPPVSYETVRSLIARLDHLLDASSTDQRKTLLHLIIKKITVDDHRQIDKIEMTFDETTEHHFLSQAPSACTTAEGAFPFDGKTPKHSLTITF